MFALTINIPEPIMEPETIMVPSHNPSTGLNFVSVIMKIELPFNVPRSSALDLKRNQVRAKFWLEDANWSYYQRLSDRKPDELSCFRSNWRSFTKQFGDSLACTTIWKFHLHQNRYGWRQVSNGVILHRRSRLHTCTIKQHRHVCVISIGRAMTGTPCRCRRQPVRLEHGDNVTGPF